MPRRAQRLCPRCHQPYSGRCPNCTPQRTDEADRPTAAQRGYGAAHRRFRDQVIRRDPTCACDGCPRCTIPQRHCLEPSTDADHHPRSRHELIRAGENPNDSQHGRGLCHPCHSHHTATTTRWGRGGSNP